MGGFNQINKQKIGDNMANSYFCNVCDEPESVRRYRYCLFKARHSKGSEKARWEREARQARREAISEKSLKDTATKRYGCYDDIETPTKITGKVSFYQTSDHSGMNLRALYKKTLPEINEAIKYWEDHLGQTDLSSIVKGVLQFQLRKLRTVKATMESSSKT